MRRLLPLLLALAVPASAAAERRCYDLATGTPCEPDGAACTLDRLAGVGVWSAGAEAVAACCAARDVCVCNLGCGAYADPCRADERCDESLLVCVDLDDPCACATDADCPANTACSAGSDSTPGACLPVTLACVGNDDCGDRGFCLDGACQPFPDCRADADCAGGTCVDGSCRYVSCVADGDCAVGLACSHGVCALPLGGVWPWCATDEACGDVFACIRGMCQGVWCTAAADCPDGRVCDETHLCRLCSADAECGELRACVEGACVAVPCVADADCGPGAFCVDGACEPGCRADRDCPSGQICVDGSCLEECGAGPEIDDPPPAVDPGTHASRGAGADGSGCATASGRWEVAWLLALLAVAARRS